MTPSPGVGRCRTGPTSSVRTSSTFCSPFATASLTAMIPMCILNLGFFCDERERSHRYCISPLCLGVWKRLLSMLWPCWPAFRGRLIIRVSTNKAMAELMCSSRWNELGEYWPHFANYAPIPRSWRNMLSDPNRLFRPSMSFAQLTDDYLKRSSYLTTLDIEFPDLFFDIAVQWLSKFGFIYIFRLAASCRRQVLAKAGHVWHSNQPFARRDCWPSI